MRPRFPHVDALRAIAALSIVAYHQAFLLGGFELERAGRWLAHLNVGVPLFFAISGFLLYRPWVAARLSGEPAPSGRVYAVRRALRIVPAYWVALTLIALLVGRSSVFEWPDAVVYYGLLQGYDAERFTGGIGPAWTLTIEVAFYVLLPFFALAMRRVPGGVRSELAVLGGVVVASLAFKALVLNVVDAAAPTYLVLLSALPAQLDTFALGMLLAVLSAAGRGRAGAAWWLVALAAFSLSVLWTPGGETARVLTGHSLQSVVAVTLLAPAVFGGMALLGWRPLMWVGLVSYGIYLWHLDAIRELVEAGLPAGVVVVAGTALAIGLGAASWYGLERYAQRLGHRRRLSRPRRAGAGGGERSVIARIAAGVLLAGPFALALSRGGFFDEARLWAAIVAWGLVGVAAVVAPRPLPRSRPAMVALAGLAGLLVWTLVSFAWAPLRAPAVNDLERLALYLGVLLAATALLRGPMAPAVVPALAAGIVAATLYGLSERLLPGVFELTRSRAAMGRLDQPLTYWNAMGAWAAIGLVLCARLASTRAIAAAGAAPLGAAVALSFSRGAIAAAVIGLAVLAVLDPRRPAMRAAAITAVAGLLAGVVAAALPAVRTLEGARESEGLALLAALVVLAAAAVALTRRETVRGPEPGRVRRRVVLAVLVGGVVLAAGAAAVEGGRPDDGASATRLSSTASNRYEYWQVALSSFADAPLQGHGSGSFAVDWLRERDIDEVVRDAHSLELETAAELGLVGLALLALLAGGVGVAAARGGAAAAGPAAGLAVWVAHSALDWDWEMPALTLIALLLGGVLLAATDRDAPRAGVAVRAATMLVAVAMVAGLAVELRTARIVEDVRQNRAAPDAIARLERADDLTLDRTTPQLELGNLLLVDGRPREAAAIGEALVAREPENPFAWGILALAYEEIDPARSREALREQQRLIGRGDR